MLPVKRGWVKVDAASDASPKSRLANVGFAALHVSESGDARPDSAYSTSF
ncbi:hypothetical protein [Duganella vulcania]|nr:hypothetical protein [Duganella vulcania]